MFAKFQIAKCNTWLQWLFQPLSTASAKRVVVNNQFTREFDGISAEYFFNLDSSSYWLLFLLLKLFSRFRVLHFSTCSCSIKSAPVLFSTPTCNGSTKILVVLLVFFTKGNENIQPLLCEMFTLVRSLFRKLRIHRIVWASDVGWQGHTEERSISWSAMHAVQVSHAWRRHWFFINLQARISYVEREW